MTRPEETGVGGPLRLLLRLEGGALLVLALVLYGKTGMPWWLFAVLFLTPDLSFLGYLAGPRVGAIAYNSVHTLLCPIALALGGFLLPSFDLIGLSLIWAAHIGFDRLLGFGLKYRTGFRFTHLGRIGPVSS